MYTIYTIYESLFKVLLITTITSQQLHNLRSHDIDIAMETENGIFHKRNGYLVNINVLSYKSTPFFTILTVNNTIH